MILLAREFYFTRSSAGCCLRNAVIGETTRRSRMLRNALRPVFSRLRAFKGSRFINARSLHSFRVQLPAVREKRKKCDFSFFEYFLIDRELVTTPHDVARGRRQATVEGACTRRKKEEP